MRVEYPLTFVILTQFIVNVRPGGEADYTLDDSFWNDESPVGEVERLLKEYRQNQELVRRIGSHYYQIIYPVQLRHHEKMGISTREVSAAKSQRPHENGQNGPYTGSGGGGRSRTRDIEHCYYHGTVKDYPGASAAFHTCNGVSGVIHLGNETFVVQPFYGGDLSKHPHVIFEARTRSIKGCANSANMEWRASHKQKHISGVKGDEEEQLDGYRYKRDVREATKYIETAIIVDKAMFEKRNGSTRAEVVHDAIQVANLADLYFRTLNTRVSVVYIETWGGTNQAPIDGGKDIGKAMSSFTDYTSRKLFKIEKDTTQLLTGETFAGGEAGMAVPDTVCTTKAVGINVDINVYEPHLLAGTMAHMIGHNIGMSHDDRRDECFCRDWHGCIMAQSIVGLEDVQPYKFSECSKKDYIGTLRRGDGLCLLNRPNELEMNRNCGNKIIEDDEECDCGNIDECERDPCCDPITCKLKIEAQCATGLCCEKCKLKAQGVVCREAKNECDISEYCSGISGICPQDVFKKNGYICGETHNALTGITSHGYCFSGDCPTLNIQCERVWGYGGIASEKQCYDQFNTKGSINGHCGTDVTGHYIKCDAGNVLCGSLQCKEGERQPIVNGMDILNSRTIISIKGVEYECKATSGTATTSEFPQHGLVKDGTPCDKDSVCVNQTCVPMQSYIDETKCPTNKNNTECFGNGVCTNLNRCHCNNGFSGPDCSMGEAVTSPPPPNITTVENTIIMEKKETPYGDGHTDKISTLSMVIILVVIVKCVFISFALMAVCYRRKTTRMKYDPPYTKKPITKSYIGGGVASGLVNHHSVEEVSLDDSNKLITYSNTFRDSKMQHIRRSQGDDDITHSEKGILKKHGYGFVLGDHSKEKWCEDNHSDNLELMTQQDSGIGGGMGGTVGASEVERTLKSLNGYHEDILEALRNAASHRGTGAGNTPSGSGSISEEILRKTLQECGQAAAALSYGEYKRSSSRTSSKENICDNIIPSTPHSIQMDNGQGNIISAAAAAAMMNHQRTQAHHVQQMVGSSVAQPNDEDDTPATGPLRIRNLEDLIRQLEHHSSRHMSPSGSEDIRMSETEADRHYRVDSSAACSESSQGSNQQLAQSQKTATILPSYNSRCRPRSDDESRFVYGRYRHPTQNRHPIHQPHSPHSTFSHHTHHGHAHGHGSHGPHSSHHSSHTHLQQDDEGIYESADHDRPLDGRMSGIGLVGGIDRDNPDSESDEFIQAQQPLARWASEDVVSVVVLDPIDVERQQIDAASSSKIVHNNILGHQQSGTNHHGDTSPTTMTIQVPVIKGGNGPMNGTILPLLQHQQQPLHHHHQLHQPPNTIGPHMVQRDYYQSPASTETESTGSGSNMVQLQPLLRPYKINVRRTGPHHTDTVSGIEQLLESVPAERYPEYKH